MGAGNAEGLEVAGVAGVLRQTGGGSLDIADAFEGLAAFREQVGFCQERGDDVLAGGESGQIAERVEDPVTQQARAHGCGGAVEHA